MLDYKSNIDKNMKTFGKIIICIIVVIVAVGIAYLINNQKGNNIDNTTANLSNATQNNTKNELNNTSNQTSGDEYIGLEENVEPIEKEDETVAPKEDTSEDENQEKEVELTGEEKAVDIVKKQYATNGQTVTFDHMEGVNYVVKMNVGTAVTWYLVNGTTWEAEEY